NDGEKVPWWRGAGLDRRELVGKPPLQPEGKPAQQDREPQADPDSGHKPVAVDEQPPGDRSNDDGDSLGQRLNADPHGVLFLSQMGSYQREHGGKRET